MFLFEIFFFFTKDPSLNLIIFFFIIFIIIIFFFFFLNFLIFLFSFFYIINLRIFFYIENILSTIFIRWSPSIIPEAYYNFIELRYFANYIFFPDFWNIDYSEIGKRVSGDEEEDSELEVLKNQELDPDYETSFELLAKKKRGSIFNIDNIRKLLKEEFKKKDYFTEEIEKDSEYNMLYHIYSEDPEYYYPEFFNYDEKVKEIEDYYLKMDKEEEKEGFNYKKYSKDLRFYTFFKKMYKRKIFLKEIAKRGNIKLYGLNRIIWPRKSSFTNFYNNHFFLLLYHDLWKISNNEKQYEIFFWIVFFFIIVSSALLSFYYISIILNMIITLI